MDVKKQIVVGLTSVFLAGVFYLGWSYRARIVQTYRNFFPSEDFLQKDNHSQNGSAYVPPLASPAAPRGGSSQFQNSSYESHQNVQKNLHAINDINQMNRMNRATSAPDVVEKR